MCFRHVGGVGCAAARRCVRCSHGVMVCALQGVVVGLVRGCPVLVHLSVR